MKYIIIGMGIYGSNLARDLTDMGHEVVGVDIRPSNIETVKDYIATVYTLDATDEASINVLPINGVDVVIVAIGENFGASVKAVALLKKAGVKKIFARAVDEIHTAILCGMAVDRIITPEQRAAFDLTQEMSLGHDTEVLKIAPDYYVMKFSAPSLLVGESYSQLDLAADFGLQLMAATRATRTRNLLGIPSTEHRPIDLSATPSPAVEQGDELTCLGSRAAFKKLSRLFTDGQ